MWIYEMDGFQAGKKHFIAMNKGAIHDTWNFVVIIYFPHVNWTKQKQKYLAIMFQKQRFIQQFTVHYFQLESNWIRYKYIPIAHVKYKYMYACMHVNCIFQLIDIGSRRFQVLFSIESCWLNHLIEPKQVLFLTTKTVIFSHLHIICVPCIDQTGCQTMSPIIT